jgi:hypothetical protein
MKVLSNELGALLMLIVDNRFACHIMNTHSRLLRHLHEVDSNVRCWCIFCYHIQKEKCKCQPIRNHESKNQPTGDKENKLFRMWDVNFECA